MGKYAPAQITADILRKSEEFFQEDGDAEDLRVAVRISCDFREFVEKQGGEPDPNDADYVMGTVISGVEFFAQVGHSCYCVVGLQESWAPDKEMPKTFPELRSSYLQHFDLLANEELHPRERLQALLSLIRLQLLFLAYFFPWGKMP